MTSRFKNTLAIGASLAAVALGTSPAMAQTTPATDSTPNQEIVVTGSLIRQNADTTTLPVSVVTQADIAKTGFTSATDLLQNLPTLQGFVPASSSVNGGGGGVTTAAIHSLPSKYTLTLIDGQRVAGQGLGSVQGGGFGVNIESIPIEAIDAVDVLRDGAGALYGADAIAGVVNFRLKTDYTEGKAFVQGALPDHLGGTSWSAGISKGYGKLSEDGFNIFLSYSHDVQNQLRASERDASRQGAFFPFTSGGQSYIFFNPTSNTEPANITLSSGTGQGKTFNPYYNANNNCGTSFAFPLTTAAGLNCRFNYAATVQDIPSTKRDSGLIKVSVKAGEDGKVWASGLFSQFNLIGQYAPPAQPLGLNNTTRFPGLFNTYVVPFAAANGYTGTTTATLNYRAVSAGGRAENYGARTIHAAAGYDGIIGGFDVHLSLVNSHVRATDTAAGGFLDFNKFSELVKSGAYNPVTGAGADKLGPAILNSRFSKTESDLKSANLSIGHTLFALPGGDAQIAVGGQFVRTKYRVDYSDLILSQSGFSTQPASENYPVGGNYGQVPFNAQRNNYAAFAELQLPLLPGLQVNAQGRYDKYDRVHSDAVFSSAADPVTGLQNQVPSAYLGNTFSAFTGKLSFRYAIVPAIAFRGSIGTGFRAPALSDIAGAITFGGSTAGTYACPFPGSAGCLPGSAQYDLLAGPNGLSGAGGLKPEKSRNYGFGVSLTPFRGAFINVDYWNVRIKNQIQSFGIAEADGFNNPTTYAALFVNPYLDPAGFKTIAFQQLPFNGGEAKYSGIDWDAGFTTRTGLGKVTLDWNGTWTLTQKYSYGAGLPFNTDLGVYGPDQQVVFKVQSNASIGLDTDHYGASLTAHYRTGYRDQAYTAGNATVFTNANGLPGTPINFAGLNVPSHATFDAQGVLKFTEAAKMTFGIKNFTDKKPPLSLQTGGGGNQVGYDGRYYDILGRTFYLRVETKF